MNLGSGHKGFANVLDKASLWHSETLAAKGFVDHELDSIFSVTLIDCSFAAQFGIMKMAHLCAFHLKILYTE